MFNKPRNTQKLKKLRQDAIGELDPKSGKTFLILEQVNRHGKTAPCPFCGKPHFHGLGDGHRVAHCGFNELTFTNGQGQTFNNGDGYIIKTKKRDEIMNYSETLLLWKPGTSENKSKQILVTPLEPYDKSRMAEQVFFGDTGACSGGAAYTSIKNGTREQNMKKVLIDFITLVVRDNVDVQAAHAAFCEIQEYRDQLSPDAPMPDKWIERFRREVL